MHARLRATGLAVLLVSCSLCGGCASHGPAQLVDGAGAVAATASDVEPPLQACRDWAVSLVHESDAGIWVAGVVKCFPQYGYPEIFALDDKGRCTLLVGYSGTFTAHLALQEREWLGALERVDLTAGDARELYTGGKRGILYQVRAHPDASFDTRVIARFPAEEIHVLASGDLDPVRSGSELLAFTHPGHVYAIRPPEGAEERFAAPRIATLSGRVRQALLLPAAPGAAPWIAAACRSGEVLLLRLEADHLEVRTLLAEGCGFGRIALKPACTPGQAVLYATRDDGLVLRLEQRGEAWTRAVIHAGPTGPRGVAAGRFDRDPAVETVAVFGYAGRVELLTRLPGDAWRAETIFTDRDKGHWLAAAELDGRNATDELIGCGYGKRVFLLARAAGYGLADDAPSAIASGEASEPRASSPRLAPEAHRIEALPAVP